MTAQQLIDEIKDLCRSHYRKPEEITINYRHDSDSDVYPVTHTGKDKSFWMRTSCKVPAKPLTAQQLIGRITKNGCLTDEVSVRFNSAESEGYPITEVWEDIFDAETNSVLESIVLVTEPEDQ
jgi:hypothetical protein